MHTSTVTSKFFFFCVSASIFLSVLSGCTKTPSDSGDNTRDSSSGGGGGSINDLSGDGTTACGVVTDGKLENPVDLGDGESVSLVEAVSNNLVIVSTSSGQQLIKIQGIGNATSDFKNKASGVRITELLSSGGVFFKASESCETILHGSRASIGSLVTEPLMTSSSAPRLSTKTQPMNDLLQNRWLPILLLSASNVFMSFASNAVRAFSALSLVSASSSRIACMYRIAAFPGRRSPRSSKSS